ncbi:MAG: transcriptional repressor [Candidatus Ancaeobacter aquaticus]|nr:transcriptional repressor [Candidatus Ancaeobacter aquaticus]
MEKEFEIFNEYIAKKGLRRTPQRELILKTFLGIEEHISIEELHTSVKEKDKAIGYTTVYRTMKMLRECGLCEEIDFGEGIMRYEHKYGHEHHDHLICVRCGDCIEVTNPTIEIIQENMASEHNFIPARHVLEIFGTCEKCQK